MPKMLKILCLPTLLLAALLLASCGEKAEVDNAAQTAQVSLASFDTDAANYVGKTVEVTGTVDHVCRHSGKKMFIVGDNADDRLKIDAGPDMAGFAIELEGSKVKVVGTVEEQRMYAADLDEMEAGLCATEQADVKKAMKAETGEGEHHQAQAEEGNEEALAQVKSLRQQLEESGKEYLAFYSVTCRSFEELEPAPAAEATEEAAHDESRGDTH